MGHVTGGAVEGRAAPFLDLRDRATRGNLVERIPPLSRRDVALLARAGAVHHRGVPTGWMRSVGLAAWADDGPVPHVADRAGDSLVPQLRVGRVIGGQDRPKLLAVAKIQHECRLLRVQWGIAVEINLL